MTTGMMFELTDRRMTVTGESVEEHPSQLLSELMRFAAPSGICQFDVDAQPM